MLETTVPPVVGTCIVEQHLGDDVAMSASRATAVTACVLAGATLQICSLPRYGSLRSGMQTSS